ncbi:histone-fold-containing protein [Choiromyces venosus 120613-1]|uniref:Histone H4 n=1 Tax=Choiromyces venosus 120613-1 TaxID=1336337 RepID=A0A3N4IWG9_9PEZI|nr:histone-fold-containing protein [Choiromyces venosus 120613-1]
MPPSRSIGRAPPPTGRGRISGGKSLSGKTGGLGNEVARMKRQRKIHRDSVHGITKGDLRRLARRGGVKRLSGAIYNEVRGAMTDHLKKILHSCTIYLDHANRKTITVTDVIHSLKRLGNPIYGFDKDLEQKARKPARV